MDLFNILTLIGGLCLFMFGMSVMGQALERSAGNKLQSLLSKFTTNKAAGFLTGLAVTAVIQSSSATTVMVVGFVNSKLMTLKQAINVIMGANVGTTVTAWILSLSGIEGDAWYIKLMKPDSFTPVLALIGLMLYMAGKSSRKKDVGTILLGFATLMFGMSTMSDAVSGLKEVPAFTSLFAFFTSDALGFFGPILGVIAGAILTAIMQSSSASVGILQALSTTGAITNGAALPIIMGQNIGTCVTALLSSAGANKNGKRAALVHLCFNVIGTLIILIVFICVRSFIPFFNDTTSGFYIAILHTIFNIICTAVLLPAASLLEKLSYKLIRDEETSEEELKLDERLLATPAVALAVCHDATLTMAKDAVASLDKSLSSLLSYSEKDAEKIRKLEDKTDHYEDVIGTYLVKLSSHQIGEQASDEAAKLLHLIGDFERISDHAVNIVESAEEMLDKGITFSDEAKVEITTIANAVREILSLSLASFENNDLSLAHNIEPLEEVIDDLKDMMRSRHISRLQQGNCTIAAGFVWSDLLTNLERTSDHCSNIGACVIDTAQNNLNLHESLREVRDDDEYRSLYKEYSKKYSLPALAE